MTRCARSPLQRQVIGADRIAVMAALNITHELLREQQQLTNEAAAQRHQVRDLFELEVEHALAADPNSHEA